MTKDEAADAVRHMIATHLDVPEIEVTDDSDLTDDLLADSLDHVELVMAMEEHFGIEITDEEAEPLESVKDWIALVHGKLGMAV